MRSKLFLVLLIALFGQRCGKVNDDCNQNNYPNAPESSWFFSYKGTGSESHGHFILSCSDGGFLQIGETGFIPNSSKILVVKVDSTGNLLWKKEFSDEGNNLGNSAIEVSDGYLICGSINENSTLIKLNKADGSNIFLKTFDNGGNDAFEHIAIGNNNIVAVGYINAQDKFNTFYTQGEGYLTFLNQQGDLINSFSINNHLSHAYRIKYYNNELIISGLTDGASDFGLIKMDSVGNLIWATTFGGSSYDHCFGMDVSNNGSVFLTGHTLSGTENWDTYTMKINNSGNKVWEQKKGNPRGFNPKFIHDEAWGVKGTNDGGCIVVAGTGDEYGRYKRKCGNNGDNSNAWHVYLIKYDTDGNIEWEKTYGNNPGNWAGEDIDLTFDGGAIVAVDDGGFGFLKTSNF